MVIQAGAHLIQGRPTELGSEPCGYQSDPCNLALFLSYRIRSHRLFRFSQRRMEQKLASLEPSQTNDCVSSLQGAKGEVGLNFCEQPFPVLGVWHGSDRIPHPFLTHCAHLADINRDPQLVLDDETLQDLNLHDKAVEDSTRQIGDWTVYRFYFENIGWPLLSIFFACCALVIISLNIACPFSHYPNIQWPSLLTLCRNMAPVVHSYQSAAPQRKWVVLARCICCTRVLLLADDISWHLV